MFPHNHATNCSHGPNACQTYFISCRFLIQGGQVGGPTAQNLIWGSLRFWWAVKFICPTAHKIWWFRAVSENFKLLCSKNCIFVKNMQYFFKRKMFLIFLKVNLLCNAPKCNRFFDLFGWAEFGGGIFL